MVSGLDFSFLYFISIRLMPSSLEKTLIEENRGNSLFIKRNRGILEASGMTVSIGLGSLW